MAADRQKVGSERWLRQHIQKYLVEAKAVDVEYTTTRIMVAVARRLQTALISEVKRYSAAELLARAGGSHAR